MGVVHFGAAASAISITIQLPTSSPENTVSDYGLFGAAANADVLIGSNGILYKNTGGSDVAIDGGTSPLYWSEPNANGANYWCRVDTVSWNDGSGQGVRGGTSLLGAWNRLDVSRRFSVDVPGNGNAVASVWVIRVRISNDILGSPVLADENITLSAATEP